MGRRAKDMASETRNIGMKNMLLVCLFACLFLYSRANNIQLAVHMNRRALDCELKKNYIYIPPASSFLLFFSPGLVNFVVYVSKHIKSINFIINYHSAEFFSSVEFVNHV